MADVVFAIPLWAFAVVGLFLVLLAVVVIHFLKNFLANSLFGIAALLVLNYYGAGYGLNLPINLITILITGILGLAGAGLLLVLHFLGIKIY